MRPAWVHESAWRDTAGAVSRLGGMSSGATIALAVIPAVVAVAGTLGATRMSNKNAVDGRKAAEQGDRRARGGSVLGRIRLLLLDASPEIIAVNINGVGDAAMPDVLNRWRGLRDELAVFAEGDSEQAVRDAAWQLTVAVENTFNRLGGVLFDEKVHTGSGPDMLAAARENYAEARSLVDRLGNLIRE